MLSAQIHYWQLCPRLSCLGLVTMSQVILFFLYADCKYDSLGETVVIKLVPSVLGLLWNENYVKKVDNDAWVEMAIALVVCHCDPLILFLGVILELGWISNVVDMGVVSLTLFVLLLLSVNECVKELMIDHDVVSLGQSILL